MTYRWKMLTIISLASIVFLSKAILSAQEGVSWMNLSRGLDDPNLHALAVDNKNQGIIFAGSTQAIYKTCDGGKSWKKVLSISGASNRLNQLYTDAVNSQTIYAATDKGVYSSSDGGKQWDLIYKGPDNESRSVHCVINQAKDSHLLWVGTRSGLFILNTKNRKLNRVTFFDRQTVQSIIFGQPANGCVVVMTSRGIYKSSDHGSHWNRALVYQNKNSEGLSAESIQPPFAVEEFVSAPLSQNGVYLFDEKKYYAATPQGLFESKDNADDWTSVSSQDGFNLKINFIERTAKGVYVATDQGVFVWDKKNKVMKEIYLGLGSKKVHRLCYSPKGDYLLAASSHGLYKLQSPDFLTIDIEKNEWYPKSSQEVLRQFDHEPSIQQIQKAAIDYAEVYPEKINQWRQAAARKAIMPTVSLGSKFGENNNVDIDRGGTNDADKFISGPRETSRDWSVGFSWDLGELLWNGDQTSIDTRSKLMVELRDDVLTQVTHFYYERRRLQVEIMIAPTSELSIEIERHIRLEELTASIDALTGGYLSKRIGLNRSPMTVDNVLTKPLK